MEDRKFRISFKSFFKIVNMAKAFLFNTSAETLSISINNGRSINIPSANTSNGQPSGLSQSITVQNDTNPTPGQFCLGMNQVVLSSPSGGETSNFTLEIPQDKWFETLQLYIFWADSHNIVWVANLDGFYSAETSGTLKR